MGGAGSVQHWTHHEEGVPLLVTITKLGGVWPKAGAKDGVGGGGGEDITLRPI